MRYCSDEEKKFVNNVNMNVSKHTSKPGDRWSEPVYHIDTSGDVGVVSSTTGRVSICTYEKT